LPTSEQFGTLTFPSFYKYQNQKKSKVYVFNQDQNKFSSLRFQSKSKKRLRLRFYSKSKKLVSLSPLPDWN